MLPKTFNIDELRAALSESYPSLEKVDLDNLLLVLQTRIFINRFSE